MYNINPVRGDEMAAQLCHTGLIDSIKHIMTNNK